MGFLEDIANKIRVWADSRYAPIGSSGGGLTIENNGTALPERSQLNIVGKNLFSGDANENKMLLFQELPKGMSIEVRAAGSSMFDCFWRHTDGYWYIVGYDERTEASELSSQRTKIKVVKTNDWLTFINVFEYAQISNTDQFVYPKMVIDTNGNIIVVCGQSGTTTPIRKTCYFWEAATQTVTTTTFSVSSTSPNTPQSSSIAIKADGTVGFVGCAKNGGTYEQYFYMERSPGVDGVWGTQEWIGATPLRAASTTGTVIIQLFFGSDGNPRLVFPNNASASSTKIAVAKRISGVWTVYDSVSAVGYSATMDNANIITVTMDSASYRFLDYADFWNSLPTGSGALSTMFSCCSVGSNMYISADRLSASFTLATAYSSTGMLVKYNSSGVIQSAKYLKSSILLPNSPVIMASPFSYVILYGRQNLSEAYAFIVRADGSMFMEAVTW